MANRTLPLLTLLVLTVPFASGCELFVHFDRSRINADTGVAMDSGPTDGGPDGGHDAGNDASIDANMPDANVDAGMDAAVLPDTGVDGGSDAGHDGGSDAGNDGGSDAGTDAWRPDMGSDAGCTNAALDCPASTDECVVPICSGGGCSTMNLGNSHVLSTGQTANDCQVVVCNPAGGTQTIADSTDHPTSTECDTISCVGTTVTHTPQSTAVHCGTAGAMVCNGAGSCVECNSPSDCSSPGECEPATCTSNVCGTMQLGTSHTMSTGQTSGNCQRLVCSGTGTATVNIDDAADLPSTTTACRVPTCSGSPLAPSLPDAPTGTACSDSGGSVCGDTTGAAGGTCVQCNVTADCTTGTCQADHTCL